MRVALISTEFPPSVDGGAGNYAGHLAAALGREGLDVTVMGPTEAAEYASPDYRFVAIAPHSAGLLRFWAALRLNVRRSSSRQEFDVLHSNGIAGLPMIPGSRRSGVVTTIHHVTRDLVAPGVSGAVRRLGDLRGETGIVPFAERFLARRSDHLIAVSHATSEALGNHYPGTIPKTSVIYSGVKPIGLGSTEEQVARIRARFNPTGQPLLLTVGRLEHRKGIDLLIEAFALLNKHGDRARLVIVGVGHRLQYEGLARRLGCLDEIDFVGRLETPDLAALYRASDLVVVPSRREGFGFVAFEAMSAGRPVVVTRTGAAQDGLIDASCGAVVEVGDVAGLTAAVERLVSDPALAVVIGARNRRRVGRMSWEGTAKATIDVYARAITAARARA